MEKIELTKKNYYGMGVLLVILLIGLIGALGKQEWAENIYTFISIVLMGLFIYMEVVKTKVKPIKQYLMISVILILFSVAADWWWVGLYWCVITISMGICMSNHISAVKEQAAKQEPMEKE